MLMRRWRQHMDVALKYALTESTATKYDASEIHIPRQQARRQNAMICIIDNYDSFTYNLVQRLGELGADLEVFRNDKVTLKEIEARQPTHLIVSPGPCTPNEAGISDEAIRHFADKLPILGVCLGHQCIAHAYGATIGRARRLMHGKTSEVHHDGKGLFAGLPNPFTATRYHSLTIVETTLPSEFEITARADEDEIMGIRHSTLPIFGVQFHPESFLTVDGPDLLQNFLNMTSA
jgi:anthranilate synthase/aminodeoxychorismate synthase-like glutamine amidotransferase